MQRNDNRTLVEGGRTGASEGEVDSRQIRHYRDVLGELREQGMEPMVTLHHFSSPLWFARRGGWAAPGSAHAFMPFVHRVIDELGDLIGLWCTINEPNIYAANGWVVGEFPPAHHGDVVGLYQVTSNMRRAHELAYSAIKRRWPDALVGLSHHKFLMLPATGKRRDLWSTKTAQLGLDSWPDSPGRASRIVEPPSDAVGSAKYRTQRSGSEKRMEHQNSIARQHRVVTQGTHTRGAEKHDRAEAVDA